MFIRYKQKPLQKKMDDIDSSKLDSMGNGKHKIATGPLAETVDNPEEMEKLNHVKEGVSQIVGYD